MDDDRQLDLLGTFHYVVAAIAALCALFPVVHLVVGVLLLTGKLAGDGGEAPPTIVGIVFVVVPLVLIVLGLVLAWLIFLTGRRLFRRRSYQFCFVVGAIECIFMPFGTVLGVLTLVALSRPSVKEKFGVRSRP